MNTVLWACRISIKKLGKNLDKNIIPKEKLKSKIIFNTKIKHYVKEAIDDRCLLITQKIRRPELVEGQRPYSYGKNGIVCPF